MARVAVLIIAFTFSGAITVPANVQTVAPRIVEIVAERFSFTPSDITVEQGAVLELRLTSDDTAHGFRLVGPGDINVEIPKRGRGDVRVRFEAKEPGRYTFECSRVCGAGHSFMRGSIRVLPPSGVTR